MCHIIFIQKTSDAETSNYEHMWEGVKTTQSHFAYDTVDKNDRNMSTYFADMR